MTEGQPEDVQSDETFGKSEQTAKTEQPKAKRMWRPSKFSSIELEVEER